MNPVVHALMRVGTRVAIAVYRRSGGRIGGKARGGVPVLLLTVPGRKTGIPRTTPVGYFEHEGGYVLTGTAGGAREDPQWFRNLRRSPEAEVEIGARRIRVRVRELLGPERDTVWRDVVLARAPSFGAYQDKTPRTIPLALLVPTRS